MVNLKILLSTKNHIECKILEANHNQSTNVLTIVSGDKGLHLTLSYYFPNLIAECVELNTNFGPIYRIKLVVHTLAACSTKYKGPKMSDIVLCTDDWIKQDNNLWNLFTKTQEPTIESFEPMDQPICGGCPLNTCINCPIFN